jgi:hypothetical protein
MIASAAYRPICGFLRSPEGSLYVPDLKPFILVAALASLGACAKDNQIDASGGITVTRSSCPAVAIPAHTGDVTLFDPPASREARAIDVVASITNLRSTCDDTGAELTVNATFDVIATRANASGAREVVLPYFATVIRGGRAVVSKRLSRVAIRFEDGQTRATATAAAGAAVNRAAATLPDDIREQIVRRRKPGDTDAAIDPLSIPEVRDAVSRTSFELLIGFQLTNEQLQYNATR